MPGLNFDIGTGTFKYQSEDFAVPMPMDAEKLANRIEVMGNGWLIMKMRYPGNPRLGC